MKRVTLSCCSPKMRDSPSADEMEIPEQVRRDLEERGGLAALATRIPSKDTLAEQSRIHHALSDPLRLTILYLVRDQPLCVCVINRFMRIAGSKLSYHLNILKESSLIDSEYHGNWIIYRITREGRTALSSF